MRFGKFDQFGPAGQIPFAPGCNHLDIGIERIITQFETDLVIALAGCAMGNGIGPNLMGDLDLAFGNERPGNRSAEQIQSFIDRIGAEHREDIIADKFFAQIVYEDMLVFDPGHLRLAAHRFQLFALAQIGGEGDDLTAIFDLQPFQYDAGVEAA